MTKQPRLLPPGPIKRSPQSRCTSTNDRVSPTATMTCRGIEAQMVSTGFLELEEVAGTVGPIMRA